MARANSVSHQSWPAGPVSGCVRGAGGAACSAGTLNWCLLILRARIFDSSVEAGRPSLKAAPDGPDTRPRVSARAASITAFSSAASLRARGPTVDPGRGLTVDPVAVDGRTNQLLSTEKVSVPHRITDRSMMFCNSLMLPGQWPRGRIVLVLSEPEFDVPAFWDS